MSLPTQKIHLFGQDGMDAPTRYRMIACEVAYRECCWATAVSRNVIDLAFLTQGLHDLVSESMRDRIQRAVDEASPERYKAVLLGFGLCNNGLVGVHAGPIPLVLPRAHDCITLFMGSKEAYQKAFEHSGGAAYYLTTGWAERDADNLEDTLGREDNMLRRMGLDKTYEQYVELYGEEHARMILETLSGLDHYRRLQHIDMGLTSAAEESVADRARSEAARRGWEYERTPGRMDLFLDLADGRWDEDRFLVVQPGQTIAASHDDRIVKAE